MTAVDNIAFIRKIYRFLEVDESFMPTIANKSVNAPIFPSTQQLIYKLGLSFIIDTMKRLRLIYTIRHAYKQFQGTKIKNTDPDIQSSCTMQSASTNAKSSPFACCAPRFLRPDTLLVPSTRTFAL